MRSYIAVHVPTVRNVEAWRLAAELCVKTGGLSGEFDWPQVVISLCREWEKHNTTVVILRPHSAPP